MTLSTKSAPAGTPTPRSSLTITHSACERVRKREMERDRDSLQLQVGVAHCATPPTRASSRARRRRVLADLKGLNSFVTLSSKLTVFVCGPSISRRKLSHKSGAPRGKHCIIIVRTTPGMHLKALSLQIYNLSTSSPRNTILTLLLNIYLASYTVLLCVCVSSSFMYSGTIPDR